MLSSEYFLKIAKINSQWGKPMCPSCKNYSFNKTEKNPQSAKINSSKNSSLLFFSFSLFSCVFHCYPLFFLLSCVSPVCICFPLFSRPVFLYFPLFPRVFPCPLFSIVFPCSPFFVCVSYCFHQFSMFSYVSPFSLQFPLLALVFLFLRVFSVSPCFHAREDSDFHEFFQYENHSFPASLSDSGKLYLCEKSQLVEIIWRKGDYSKLRPTRDAIIIDGSAIVNASLLGKSKAFD